MNRHPHPSDQRGAVLVTVALFLLLLLGFTALGVEAGRWYLIRAELSKSVDAGALVGARNLSNPNVDPRELAHEFTVANFPTGYLATPGSGTGTVAFDVQMTDGGRVSVNGSTDGASIFGQLAGLDQVPVSSSGVAQKQEVEIMLVLDRSGSMATGGAINDLKVAAKSFVDFFAETEAEDRMGLISFSTYVRLDRAVGNGFVAPLKTAIDAMNAADYTNTEDALDRVDGPGGLTDQSAVPPERRRQQFVIFFSDGRPTALRSNFLYRGTWRDAVVTGSDNADPTPTVNGDLKNPTNGASLGIDPRRTGDGMISSCSGGRSVRWELFDYLPVPGYPSTYCLIPADNLGRHFTSLTTGLALNHAQGLKDDRVVVYAIGLGDIDRTFLESIASSPSTALYTPDSSELRALFQKVALEIKLRLVQ